MIVFNILVLLLSILATVSSLFHLHRSKITKITAILFTSTPKISKQTFLGQNTQFEVRNDNKTILIFFVSKYSFPFLRMELGYEFENMQLAQYFALGNSKHCMAYSYYQRMCVKLILLVTLISLIHIYLIEVNARITLYALAQDSYEFFF